MGWIIVALIIGWAAGRNWDTIMRMINEKKHTIQTKSNSSDSSD